MRVLILSFLVIIFSFSLAYSQNLIASFDPTVDNNTIDICDVPGDVKWDGQVRLCEIGGRIAVKNIDYRHNFYFAVKPELKSKVGDHAWLLIEGTSDVLGDLKVRYNSKTDNYSLLDSVRTLGDSQNDYILYELPDSDFRGTQNAKADFRIETNSYYIYRLEIYDSKPNINVLTNEERKAKTLSLATDYPKYATKNMSYVLGDSIYDFVDMKRRWAIPFGHNSDLTTIKYLASLGATSLESYVTWEICEPYKQGEWAWGNWDKQVASLKSNGLKLTPFLIAGPAYSVPAWFRETKDHVSCACLEHDIPSKIESLWNPGFEKWVDRFVKEFATRYNSSDILDNVLLGIQGDYGEAIYSVSGGWTQLIPGDYHAHYGFWCNDPYALISYKKYLSNRYLKISALNKVWKTDYKSFDEIDYPARGEEFIAYIKDIPNKDTAAKRQYLDFVTWYRVSMIDLAEKWFKITDKYFSNDIPVYLCTGGSMEPGHGSDFSLQCKLAAKYKGGVRITNEGYEYKWNNCLVRLVDSAARFYGAKFAHEPASDVSGSGLTARIYGAVSSGATHHHEYARNIFSNKERLDSERKSVGYLEHYTPIIPVTLFYPNISLTLDFNKYWGLFTSFSANLRDVVDHDYTDEVLLRDKALNKYKILIIRSGDLIEISDAKIISKWANGGGNVIAVGSDSFANIEDNDASEKILFPKGSKGGIYGKGYIVRVPDIKSAREIINKYFADNNYPVYDMSDDLVYGAMVAKDTILYHNSTETDKTVIYSYKRKLNTVIVPAYGIEKVKFN